MRYKHNKSSNKSAYTPTDENYGLTSKEAKLRLRKHGPNIIFDSRQEKASKVFFKLFYDPVSLLLLVCSLVMFTYNDIASSLLVVFIWLAHNTITLLIYYKSHQIMSTVKSYGIPKCKVLRDGKLYLIDSRLLVVGDIVYIGAGDIICADCNILSSSDLYVYEHDVTGKEELSHKYASDDSDVILLSDMHGSLFASSSVVRGSAVCTVIATADDTEIVSGAGLINIKGTDHSDLFFDIKKKCRRLGISSIIIALSLFLLKIVLSPSNIFDCFLIVVALIASSMIETLLPLSQIVCSRYIYGAATDKRGDSVVIKNPGAIDALRELDTILITDEFIDRCDFDIKKELPLAIKILICSEGKKAFSVASKYYLPVYKDIFEFFTAKANICVYPISDYSDRIELLDKLHKNGKTIIMVTHDLEMACSMATKVLCVNRTLLYCGAAPEIHLLNHLLYGCTSYCKEDKTDD